MRVQTEMSIEQEELVADHLLEGKKLYVAESEKVKLVQFVRKTYPGYRISSAEMDLENARWNLDLEPVTVTT